MRCCTTLPTIPSAEALSPLAGLYLRIGDPFLPGKQGSAWAILVVWVGGHVGAFLAELVRKKHRIDSQIYHQLAGPGACPALALLVARGDGHATVVLAELLQSGFAAVKTPPSCRT